MAPSVRGGIALSRKTWAIPPSPASGLAVGAAPGRGGAARIAGAGRAWRRRLEPPPSQGERQQSPWLPRHSHMSLLQSPRWMIAPGNVTV